MKKVKKVFFHRRSENEKQKQTLHKLWKCHFLIKANPNLCHISDEVVSEEMGRRAVVTLDNGCKRLGFESLNPKRKRAFYSCYKYTVIISVFYSPPLIVALLEFSSPEMDTCTVEPSVRWPQFDNVSWL